MVKPVSNITQIEIIKSDSKSIVRKSIKKGVIPSLEQIDKWFKDGLPININEGYHQIKGRIRQIGPYRSETKADAIIWIENHPFGVYIRDINHFEVEEIEEIFFPMILDSSFEFAKNIQTVTLVSNGKKFVVNQERLCEEVPFFKAMLYGGFQELTQNEKDVSELLSHQQLELILLYLDGQVLIDRSNVIDLFIESDKLLINEINYKVREYLVRNLTLEEIQSLKSNVNYPPLQDFLSAIDNEKIKFYQNQHSCPIGDEINQLLKVKKISRDRDCLRIITEHLERSDHHSFNLHVKAMSSPISESQPKRISLTEEGEAKAYLLNSNNRIMDALNAAVSIGNVEEVRYLLSLGAGLRVGVSIHRDDGYSMFIFPTLIESCCSQQENINIRENQFICLALVLCYAEDLESIRNQRSFLGSRSPVEIACNNGRQDLMELLLNFGFQWPVLNQEDARKKLFINAVVSGHLEIVRWFIKTYKMDVNYHDDFGITILHMAKAARKESVVDYLLMRGANPKALTSEGQDYQTYGKHKISVRAAKALAHYSRTMAGFDEFKNFKECNSHLMEQDINHVINSKGDTILHIAAQWPNHKKFYKKIIPALLRKGAELMARNNKGQTPYDIGIATIEKSYRKYVSEKELQKMYNRVEQLNKQPQ